MRPDPAVIQQDDGAPASHGTGTDPSTPPRVDMAGLLRKGAKESSEKARRRVEAAGATCVERSTVLDSLRALSWRQQFQFDQMYSLAMLGGQIQLEVRQVEMGEPKGASTVLYLASTMIDTRLCHGVRPVGRQLTGLGTGANVWPAAAVLAKYLERRYGAGGMKGLRVVELGCGTGLTGLAAGILGAETWLTDQAQILPLTEDNKQRVCSSVGESFLPQARVHVCEYDWGSSAADLLPPVDVVLVSDCLLPKLYPIEPLVEALDTLAGRDTVVLLSYEHRVFPLFDARIRFSELLSSRRLTRRSIPYEELDQEYWCDDIEVWEICRHMP